MTNFLQSETRKNLARAFAGECQAGARYQFLGTNATNEEFAYLQQLMKGLAKNEMAHAKVFYDHIIELGGENQCNIDISCGYPFSAYDMKTGFKQASLNELSEHKNIYPSFAKIAKDEGFEKVAESFTLVASVEKCHFLMLKEIDEKIQKNALYKSVQPVKWKCDKCGYEATSKSPWKTCPLCKFDQGYTMIELSDQ